MKKRTTSRLLAAALCVLLAGCGAQNTAPNGSGQAPAPQQEASQNQKPEVQDPAPQPAEDPDPALPDPVPAPAPAAPEPSQQGAEPVPLAESSGDGDSVADNYVGTWRDDARGTSGGRCYMEIACEDGVNYSIDIWWGSSAAETTHWQYTGVYDETWAGIDYIGTRYRETTQADGTVERAAELEEATGLIYLEDGALLWEDTFEHQGEGMRFSREVWQ